MTHQSKLLSWLGAFLLTICVAGLSGCSDWLDGFETPGTVREATLKTMANLNMDRAAPVMLRIYKEEESNGDLETGSQREICRNEKACNWTLSWPPRNASVTRP